MRAFCFVNSLFFLILMSGKIVAQENSTNSERRWSIVAQASPNFCNKVLTPDQLPMFEVSLNQKVKPKMGYQVGSGVIYEFTTHFQLQAEVRFSSLGVRTISEPCTNPEIGASSMCKSYYNFNYIDLPISVNYILGTNKLRYVFSAYFSGGFLVRYTLVDHVEPPTGDRYKKIEAESKKTEWSPFAGVRIGVTYQLNDNWSILALPEYRIGLHPDFYSSHLMSFGLNVGVVLKL